MKLFIYNLLTNWIVRLGKLRAKLNILHKARRDRMGVIPVGSVWYDECCDCGLEHKNLYAEKKGKKRIKWLAMRPKKYNYKGR